MFKYLVKGFRSLGKGFGSIFNLFPHMSKYNDIKDLYLYHSEEETLNEVLNRDAEAIKGDWENIGKDLSKTIEELKYEVETQSRKIND